MPSLVHQGGWVKREAEATYGAGEGADDDASATRGTTRDVGAVRGGVSAARGMDEDVGAVCGASGGAGALHGTTTISEVPATEEE
jgi:hypothetical protein